MMKKRTTTTTEFIFYYKMYWSCFKNIFRKAAKVGFGSCAKKPVYDSGSVEKMKIASLFFIVDMNFRFNELPDNIQIDRELQ